MYRGTKWVDHAVDPVTGALVQQGTPQSAGNFNKIERGIADGAISQAIALIAAEQAAERTREQIEGKKAVRAATVVIGTSARGWTAADCDFLCDGVDDQAEIQAAVDYIKSLGSGTGTIKFLSGTYNLSDTVYITHAVSLVGDGVMGYGPTIKRAFPPKAPLVRDGNGDFVVDYTDAAIYATKTVRIDNLTFYADNAGDENSKDNKGGLVTVYKAAAYISNSYFSGNPFGLALVKDGLSYIYQYRISNCLFNGGHYYALEEGYEYPVGNLIGALRLDGQPTGEVPNASDISTSGNSFNYQVDEAQANIFGCHFETAVLKRTRFASIHGCGGLLMLVDNTRGNTIANHQGPLFLTERSNNNIIIGWGGGYADSLKIENSSYNLVEGAFSQGSSQSLSIHSIYIGAGSTYNHINDALICGGLNYVNDGGSTNIFNNAKFIQI